MKIVIVGGGSAGWMAAAALARVIDDRWSIALVESDAIGTVGVGEATIPQIRLFNELVGIDEAEFIRRTKGSFKLGIEFRGWGGPGDRYIHAFGAVGRNLGLIPFHHYWLQARARGDVSSLAEYSLSAAAAAQDRFMREDPMPSAPLGGATYAYHFDAGLYAAYLREIAEDLGVIRHEGRITDVARDGASGNFASVELDNGDMVTGDLFIDCSGFAALLIGKTMESPFVDWSHWLPCDRAVAVPCDSVSPLTPYTRSTARAAGWQWRIPLQHRIGNGYVYSSAFTDDQTARETLIANLDGQPQAEPRQLRFTAGCRREMWRGNVIALGLASGFLEPLESTSIHLVQAGIKLLIDLLPGGAPEPSDIAAYNRRMMFDYERIRDFIILHYHANGRDEPLWRHCREMTLPDTLLEKIDQFRAGGRIMRVDEELFTELGWLQVLIGQGVIPRGYHPLADAPGNIEVDGYLGALREFVAAKASRMPDHGEYLRLMNPQIEKVSA